MWRKKILASLTVLICLSASSSAVAYAESVDTFVDDGISLTYEIAGDPSSDLAIIGSTAYCTSKTDSSGAVSITVTQTLQKYWGLWIWNDVEGAEWTRTVDRNSICLTSSKSGLDSGTYRVKSVFTLTDCAVVSLAIGRFSFDDKTDYSKLFIENLSSDKTRIEEYYGLPEEDGWEITNYSELSYCTLIEYARGDETVIFGQEIIQEDMGNVNTENAVVEPMSIYEENDGFFIRFKHGDCGMWWIYDGYLFHLAGNLDKSELVNLAYSTKIVKF